MNERIQELEALGRRILVIDDNEAIHDDFRKILMPNSVASDELLAAEADLFGEAPKQPAATQTAFELVTATQGKEGYDRVAEAAAAGRPFAMAFVDMRMPPGWDGLETIENIWRDYPDVEMVICTAFSDYSWEETIDRLGRTDRLLIVKKPFDHIEVLQVACALTRKWQVQRHSSDLLDGLAEMVRERTRELERARDELVLVNQDLLIAKDLAEAANDSKTMFLANMSHELRTPITAILGYSQELEERQRASAESSFEQEAVVTIRRNASHLVGLVGDLLDVAKLETGQLSVTPRRCALVDLLAELQAELAAKAKLRGLDLQLVYASPVPEFIESDELRLRQVLINLIENGIKFTEKGGVRIEVSYRSDPAPRLAFEVVDTGIGMSAEAIARVFLPFEQADVSTTRRFGGSGLGLAISLQIAKLLGGSISAVSKVGEGSRFLFEMAVGVVAPVAMVHGAQPRSRAPVRPLSVKVTSGTRVLLVEDGRDNQRLIRHLLKKAGCEVDVAENGAECLERMADDDPFDVVLMDMQMPVMGGVEATEALRKRGCRVPIVALTANAMESDRDACMLAGCDEFLTKPIDRSRLIEVIQGFVD